MNRDWRQDAKCRGSDDPRWINPSAIKVPRHADAMEWRDMIARSMCSGCPVMKECMIETVEEADIDQVKAGRSLWVVEWKARDQHNEMREILGLPTLRTNVDSLKERYPQPCSVCEHPIRIYPMSRTDYPGTRLGTVTNNLCYLCEAKSKEEKENGVIA